LEIFYDHLVYFTIIWYIFPRFGISYQEKSGNPASYSDTQIGQCLNRLEYAWRRKVSIDATLSML
jgi:hypothetical protein